LVNACNQKSNREPVMNLDEDAVRGALRSLSDQFMARSAGGDSRVAKYEHRVNELFNFHRHEIAVLCVLLLRGLQTLGELRARTERLYAFEDLDSVHSAINLLMKREPPLVAVLPRQPGTKESRYMHLLSGSLADSAASTTGTAQREHYTAATPQRESDSARSARITSLESEVAALRQELADLREQFAAFRKQFQ